MKVTRKGGGVARIKTAMAALKQTTVLVGIPASSSSRDGDGPNNAALGYLHEFGSPARNIPARPFLVPGVKAAAPRAAAELAKAGRAALTGEARAVLPHLHAAGMVAASSVKNTINQGVDPPLSDRTLMARAARGRQGAKDELNARAAGMTLGMAAAVPLVDTGAMRNAITYVVKLGGRKAEGGKS